MLLLGGARRGLLQVVRSLGRTGVEVHLAWHEPHGSPAASRFVVAAHSLPPYTPDDDSWIQPLIDLMVREQFALVLPADDLAGRAVVRGRSRLEPFGRLGLSLEGANGAAMLSAAVWEASREETGAQPLFTRVRDELRSELAFDDPVPSLTRASHLLRRGWDRLSRLAPAWYLTLPFVRRSLHQRALQALAEATNLLFVCKGNVCRSPFAEHLARHHLPSGRRVTSAGYYWRGGRSCPRPAVEAASRWDVSLLEHSSHVLTPEIVRAADAIFVFDYDNYRRILADYPFAPSSRVNFIGALCPSGPLFVKDPWGKDAAAYQRAYSQIAAALERAYDEKFGWTEPATFDMKTL